MERINDIFEFEVYTKNKIDKSTGWEIAFPAVVAESKRDAIEKLKAMPHFDCVIAFNRVLGDETTGFKASELNKKAVGLLTDLIV